MKTLMILGGLCICLVLLGMLFVWWIQQPLYVFYDGDKQQWKDIEITFPSIWIGDGISFRVSWDPLLVIPIEEKTRKFIDEYYDGNLGKFFDEFNRSIEIIQTRNGEKMQIPIDLAPDRADFGLISVPDKPYPDKTHITIRMKEPLRSKHIPGNIEFWKAK